MKNNIVFIGSGASSTYSLVHLVDELIDRNLDCAITVLERYGHFHAGVAYGERSASEALILTSLKDFFPSAELLKFASWAKSNRMVSDLVNGPNLAWLPQNLSDVELAAAIAPLCVRRRMIGLFLKHRADEAIAKARDVGIPVQLVQMDVERVESTPSGYSVKGIGVSGQALDLEASDVIVCVGSPPVSHSIVDNDIVQSPTVIESMYERGFDPNLDAFCSALRSSASGQQRVVVMGSNASSMEMLYLLKQRLDEIPGLRITVVSGTGALPEQSTSEVEDDGARADALRSLLKSPAQELTAKLLYNGALKDLERLKLNGYSITQCNRVVDREILAGLERMPNPEKLDFLRRYANYLGRYKRRSEREYHDAAESLVESGHLELLAGSVTSVSPKEPGIAVHVRTESGDELELKVDSFVNCGCSEPVDDNSSNPVIANLIASGLAQSPEGSIGFATNEDFSIGHSLYVFGPLLSGNIVEGKPVWHMEHCGRILEYSVPLARQVAEGIECRTDSLLKALPFASSATP